MSATKRILRLLSILPLGVVVILIAGCGGGGKGKGDTVSGKVTLNGNPVAGEVIFIGSDGKESKMLISMDGSYTVASPAKGEAKIGVKSMGSAPAPSGAGKSDMPGFSPASGVPAPAKYNNPSTSGLTYTVKGGDEKFDIVLTP